MPTDLPKGVSEVEFIQYENGVARSMAGAVAIEEQVVLTVNAIDLVGMMCTPMLLEELALGFLFNEGLIDGTVDVADVRVCGTGRCIDVWLYRDVPAPAMRTITSGCSGGATFESLVDARHPVSSDLSVTPGQITALMHKLQDASDLYRRARGVHASALATGQELICVAEDVGRHNTVDKLVGLCLRQERSIECSILLTSGRVSSEMLAKAAHIGAPVVVSRTSPTSLAVGLACAWNMTLIGYARGGAFRVYAGAERIVGT